MKTYLPLSGFAIAGPGAEHALEEVRVDMPTAGTRRSGGRAGLLAAALATQVMDEQHDRAAVLFGTALGSLTETEAFLEHMIEAEEATPKPRAFASSVHNSIASRVAMAIQAHGECQTHVEAELSFAHALTAASFVEARTRAPIYIGAVDEACKYVDRGLEACGHARNAGEGGAVLAVQDTHLVWVTHLAIHRFANPAKYTANIDDPGAIVLVPGLDGSYPDVPGASRAPFDTFHSSLTATATALAFGMLIEEVSPSALGLDHRPPSITLITRSRFGDHSWITLSE